MKNIVQRLVWDLTHFLRFDSFDLARERLSQDLRSDDDWQALTPVAGRHRLLGYLVYLVKDDSSFPPLAIDQSKRIYEGIRVRYALQCGYAEEVAQIFEGLPFRFLKGLVIASGAHSIPHLRPCGDIDILLPPASCVEGIQRLIQAGWSWKNGPAIPWPPPAWLRKADFPLHLDEVVLCRGSAVLEIHSNIASYKLPHAVSEQELWSSVNLIVLKDLLVSLPTLSNEDVWLHLLINHHMHRFSGGLGILLDLAKWEERHPLDMSAVARRIETWKIGYLIDPPLAQLKALFPDLPSVRTLASRLEPDSSIFSRVERAWSSSTTPWYWIRRSPAPLRTLWRNVFPPREAAALRYGKAPSSPQLWMYRAGRPLELVARHAKRMFAHK